jgi:hypothetical protein
MPVSERTKKQVYLALACAPHPGWLSFRDLLGKVSVKSDKLRETLEELVRAGEIAHYKQLYWLARWPSVLSLSRVKTRCEIIQTVSNVPDAITTGELAQELDSDSRVVSQFCRQLERMGYIAKGEPRAKQFFFAPITGETIHRGNYGRIKARYKELRGIVAECGLGDPSMETGLQRSLGDMLRREEHAEHRRSIRAFRTSLFRTVRKAKTKTDISKLLGLRPFSRDVTTWKPCTAEPSEVAEFEAAVPPPPRLSELSTMWDWVGAEESAEEPRQEAAELSRAAPSPPPPSPALPPEPPAAARLEPAPSEAMLQPPPRYADFALCDDAGVPLPSGCPLVAQAWYDLEIAVRAQPIGIPPEELKRRAIREPRQAEDVLVMVAVEGHGFEIPERVGTLILPPLGDSTDNAFFRVRPVDESPTADRLAEITVRLYYGFNLLEVALIRAEVVGELRDATVSRLGLDNPISFRQERLELEYVDLDDVLPRMMHIDVAKREGHFLFRFAFYDKEGQKLVFSAADALTPAELEDSLVGIRKLWYDIAMSKTFTEQVEGTPEEFRRNVRKLAGAGHRLWVMLFKHDPGSAMYAIGESLEAHPLKRDGIIQVSVSKDASGFVFPWALVYDRRPPRRNDELPDPQGFWGIRYCIEHQSPSAVRPTDGPVHVEGRLRLAFSLWDRFRNAADHVSMMRNLVTESSDRVNVSLPPITDADACFDLLRECDSHVLYFYTHGHTRHRVAGIGVGPNLDLFTSRYERLAPDDRRREQYRFLYESTKRAEFEPDRSWIELTYGKLYLDDLYYDIKALPSRPLVFLNMCESAQIIPSLSDSFFDFFLTRGAMGVIGTECPMTIEFAHPFAEMVLRGLLAGEQVGAVLLTARRHFLVRRNPLGLAYTLFGRATACFRPPSLPRTAGANSRATAGGGVSESSG